MRRYRKVRLSETGKVARSASPLDLLISDGIAEEFATLTVPKGSRRIPKPPKDTPRPAPTSLSTDGEALATRLKEWRTTEAKRLRVPPYCVLHDRSLLSVALTCPTNPRELLAIEGIGLAKVEKFGPPILEICGAK